MLKENKKVPDKQFVELKEEYVYRLTITCDIINYIDMLSAINGYGSVIKEEIEREV